jgi:hypothetical protein
LLMHILPELARLADGAAFTRTMRRLDAVQQCERLSYRGHPDLLPRRCCVLVGSLCLCKQAGS